MAEIGYLDKKYYLIAGLVVFLVTPALAGNGFFSQVLDSFGLDDQGPTGLSVGADGDQNPYETHSAPGRIQAENFDEGGEGIAYEDDSDSNNGGAYRDTDVDIQDASDETGEYNIAWIRDGEWLEYTVNVEESGVYDVDFRTAAKHEAGSISVLVDGEEVGNVDVPSDTDGWQSYVTKSLEDVELEEGSHVITLQFSEGDFNVNWFEFKYKGESGSSGGGGGQVEGKTVEDWEDGDFSEWNNVVDDWSIVEEPVYGGSKAGGLANSGFERIYSLNGLENYPSSGDSFEMRLWMDENRPEVRTLFGYQDSNPSASNTYKVEVSPDSNRLALLKEVNGQLSLLDSNSLAPPKGEWLELEVEWGDAESGEPIKAVLKDSSGGVLGEVSAIDGEYTEGGVGFYARSNPHYFDSWVITESGNSGDTGNESGDETPPDINTDVNTGEGLEKEVHINVESADPESTVNMTEIFVNGEKEKVCDKGNCGYSTKIFCGNQESYYVKSYNSEGLSSRYPESGSVSLGENCKDEQSAYGSPREVPGGIEAENYDEGGSKVSFNDKTGENEGGDYRSNPIDISSASSHHYAVTSMEENEWLEYTVKVNSADKYDLKASVSSNGGGTLKAWFDDKPVGKIEVPGTGGYSSWQNVSTNDISLDEGEKILRLQGLEGEVNLNWMEICPCNETVPQLNVESVQSNSASLSLDNLLEGTEYEVKIRDVEAGQTKTVTIEPGEN